MAVKNEVQPELSKEEGGSGWKDEDKEEEEEEEETKGCVGEKRTEGG